MNHSRRHRLAAMEETVRAFMHRYEVPGFSVAIAHHGQFVYRRAFGWADQEAGERATPANVFRIGSVSKPITSVAIFTLIERKRLKLNDFVFGREGVLGFDYGTRFLDGVQRITIDHLLTHTCGGWSDNGMNYDFGPVSTQQFLFVGWTTRRLQIRNSQVCRSERKDSGDRRRRSGDLK
jgi:CubicO group peptidase (beta-lactamase class C family)